MPSSKRHNHPIDADEAARALYLDFEGPGPSKAVKNPLPVFAGLLCEDEYRPTVLDTRLDDAATARGLGFCGLDEFLESLLKRARDENRRIVFWTSHEEELFQERGYPPGDIGFDVRIDAKQSDGLKTRFAQFKRDEKDWKDPKSAKSRKKKLRPKAFGLLTLLTETIGLPRSSGYGAGLVGKWIRTMLDQAEKKASYEDWSRGGKGSLTKLIKHNEHDCIATEYLLNHLLDPRPSILTLKQGSAGAPCPRC